MHLYMRVHIYRLPSLYTLQSEWGDRPLGAAPPPLCLAPGPDPTTRRVRTQASESLSSRELAEFQKT